MSDTRGWWEGMTTRRRVGLAVGTLAIVAATAAAGYFTMRQEYQVLFADLAPQDAAAMAAELDRLKVPYRLADAGDALLVPQDLVHKTRMKLMAKDLPLRGAVGFELFNNADFGMTEFAQKVNYQRALQGEITRTIMAIDDVLNARVHLAIPEQGLFKKAVLKPKASITIAMKPGRALRAEQVAGIQRLVSSAIPDIAAHDVTIVNQQGVALTRNASAEGFTEATATRLDSKRATEEYLARKAADVLERALGPGEAMATVDVILNHDQTRVTVEDVLPSQINPSVTPAGVIVRQRQLVRDANPTAIAASDIPRREAGSGHLEIDYQVGRRTEQVVTAPGAIQRLGVAVVVRAAADKAQLERVKNLVSVAVGFDSERGDGIAVYSMEQLPSRPASVSTAKAIPAELVLPPLPPRATPIPDTRWQETPAARDSARAIAALPGFALAALALALIALVVARRRQRVAPTPAIARALSAPERDAMLAKVREWLAMKSGPAEAKR